MTDPRTGDFLTVTLRDAVAALAPDGTAALLLRLEEAGTIAFAVNLRTIAQLRQALTDAETFLNQQPGRS